MTPRVSQAAREAAASMWAKLGPSVGWQDWQVDWLRDGTGDFGPVNQAFATFEAEIREQCANQRDLLSCFVASLTNGGRNRANTLSINHDQLNDLVRRSEAAIRSLSRTSEEETHG